ncbi:hypothetical protein K469DRAFT_239649 [Zopfia rhizophila CBS 207.26]|uniref:Uncharacterized protein n=1 Tax=Zopfia rhizophila CBS 207.26 TaxID=1314779 RepID=A0A6A6EPY7_9PEZI|nr:hypothetical protein K469DRAFT_239649 [Zopfia rhizophila CBS 207.26]
MDAENTAKIQVVLGNHLLDIPDALGRYPGLVLKTLTDAFFFIRVDQTILNQILLRSIFGSALHAKRDKTPYRLQAILKSCQSGTLDKSSLEAKVYRHGGITALVALFAAATDDKRTSSLLNTLPEDELEGFVKSINAVEPHEDFQFLVEQLKRKKMSQSSRPTKKMSTPGSCLSRYRQRQLPTHNETQGLGEGTGHFGLEFGIRDG